MTTDANKYVKALDRAITALRYPPITAPFSGARRGPQNEHEVEALIALRDQIAKGPSGWLASDREAHRFRDDAMATEESNPVPLYALTGADQCS